MLALKFTSRMKKDMKLLEKQRKDLSKLKKVFDLLIEQIPLPPEYLDHQLQGRLSAYRECHIEGDWLLVYKISEKELVLYAVATGSHSNALTKYLK
jgi:mRNA interferase YafQ